jgi:hypothetical protein
MNEQQAAYVLDYLVRAGRVSQREITRIVAEGIRQTEDRLKALRDGLAARAAAHSPRATRERATPGRRKRRPVSPEVAASRKLQGTYIALLRQTPERQRGKFRKLAKTKGREVAVKAMQRLRK